MAYYVDRKEFNKEVKNINKKLFSGFNLFNRLFSEEKNKYVEHFATLPNYNEIIDDKKTNEQLSKSITLAYQMTREERYFLIKEALAESLGFESYFSYKRKTKFLKDREDLKKLDSINFDFFSSFEIKLQEKIKEKFKFTKKIDLKLNSIMNTILKGKKNKFFEKNYKDEKECFELFLFVIGNETSKIKNIYNIDNQENENLLKIKKQTSLIEEYDIYEDINNVYVLSELTKEKDGININFIKNYTDTSQLVNCKEIKNLDQSVFDIIMKNAKETLYSENIKLLAALYGEDDDIYLKTMIFLNSKLNNVDII